MFLFAQGIDRYFLSERITLLMIPSLSLTGESIKEAAEHLPKLRELVMYGFLPVPKPGVLSSIATGCPLLSRLDISYCRLNATVCEAVSMVSFYLPSFKGPPCLPICLFSSSDEKLGIPRFE